LGFFWVGLPKGFESFAEASCVFVRDGEDADAALRAAWVADEVMAAAAVGVGYGGVYDLDEGLCHVAFVEGFARCASAHLLINARLSSYGTCGSAVRYRE
jgi:hypothetical protein